jgi:hypothetical protein
MSRVLTISHVTVPPSHDAEYVRTVQQLAEIARGRAQQLWLYRNPAAPGSYIEFSESGTEMTHRTRASRTELEERLERRLREIADYAPGAWELWTEVPDGRIPGGPETGA